MPYIDPVKQKEYFKEYYKKNKKDFFWRGIKTRFGMTQEQFWQLYELQNGCCGLCEKPFQGFSRTDLHIDHDHETNEIRGLLCMTCNVGLGMLGDTVNGIERALNYLRRDKVGLV